METREESTLTTKQIRDLFKPKPSTLTRKQIREIFKRNRSAANALAADLGVSHVLVSKVLRGKDKSQRVLDAAHAMALELIRKETAA